MDKVTFSVTYCGKGLFNVWSASGDVVAENAPANHCMAAMVAWGQRRQDPRVQAELAHSRAIADLYADGLDRDTESRR